MQFIWIGVGGAVGSMLRYAIGLAMASARFPWATLLVNVSGAFAIGFLFTWGLGRLSPRVTTPLAVGVLGGFTTFSAFVWEGLTLTGRGQNGQAIAYMAASLIGGLAAAILGRLAGEAVG